MLVILSLPFISESIGVVLDETQVQKVEISSIGLTRLSVKDDRIRDIFVYPGNASEYVTLHKSGNVFISPQEKGETFSLTVMTASGIKQDLLFLFREKPAVPLLLQPKMMKLKTTPEMLGKALIETMYRDQAGDQTLVPGLFQGEVKTLFKNIIFETVAGYKIPTKYDDSAHFSQVIVKAKIKNNGVCSYVFTSKCIREAVAVCATFETLPPGGEGFVYFIKKKKEKTKQ